MVIRMENLRIIKDRKIRKMETKQLYTLYKLYWNALKVENEFSLIKLAELWNLDIEDTVIEAAFRLRRVAEEIKRRGEKHES